MDKKFSRIENLWPRDGSCPLPLRSKRIYTFGAEDAPVLLLLAVRQNIHMDYRDMSIPADANTQRQLLRGLLNIRAPRRSRLLQIQDEYLQGETIAKGILRS